MNPLRQDLMRVQNSLIREVALALSSSVSQREVFQRCLRAIVTHLDAAFACIWLLEDDGRMLKLCGSAGQYTQVEGDEFEYIPVGKYKIGTIASEKAPHLTNDVQHDPRIRHSEWAKREGMVAFAGYPLLLADRCIGVLALFSKGTLPAGVLDILSSIVDIIALGVERLRVEEQRITEQKRSREALEQQARELARSNEELERFAYVASHDLKEPLRVVIGHLQLLQKKTGREIHPTWAKHIDLAAQAADRMYRLIGDLLEYSMVGISKEKITRIDCNQLMARVLENLQSRIEESGAKIRVGPLPVIHGAESQCLQLFQNLVGNGIKFRGANPPQIEISASMEKGFHLFSVKDNGIGIAPEHAEKIFELFERLHDRSEYSGTGIGLSICKKIVEQHGGKIWVRTQPGRGSEFFFTLPVMAEPKNS